MEKNECTSEVHVLATHVNRIAQNQAVIAETCKMLSQENKMLNERVGMVSQENKHLHEEMDIMRKRLQSLYWRVVNLESNHRTSYGTSELDY